MNRPASSRRNNRGFTLVELCAGIGVCAALLGQAVPAMGKLRQQQTLKAVSGALATDLRFARSEAARMSESVYFRVSAKGAQACYILYTGVLDGCDCAGGQAVCKTTDSAVIKTESLPSKLQLRSNAETLTFQHRQGLVTQTGSIDISLDSGPSIRQVVAISGRVRSCAVGAKLLGMPKC